MSDENTAGRFQPDPKAPTAAEREMARRYEEADATTRLPAPLGSRPCCSGLVVPYVDVWECADCGLAVAPRPLPSVPTAAELNGTAEDAPAEHRCATCFETRAGGAGACADPFHGAGEKAGRREGIHLRPRLDSVRALIEPNYTQADIQERGGAILTQCRIALASFCDWVEHVEAVRSLVAMQRAKHAAEAERDALKGEAMRQAAECGESLAEIVKLRGALAEAKAAAHDATKQRDGLRLELAQLRESTAREVERLKALGLEVFDSGGAVIAEQQTKLDNAEALCVLGEDEYQALKEDHAAALAKVEALTEELRREREITATTAELAQERLHALMSDISESCWCAGWIGDLEFDLWAMVQGGARQYGTGEVTEGDIASLKRLAELAGGWWRWNEFLTLDQWTPIYAAGRPAAGGVQ